MGKKEMSRMAMIEGAKSLFMAKGIAKVTVEDIGKRAGLTRRTVYRHFTSKEEVAFEVVIGELEKWNDIQAEMAICTKGNGLERLEEFLKAITDYLAERRNLIRLFADFDYYFSDQNIYQPTAEIIERFNNIAHFTENIILGMLKDGIEDGSIRNMNNTKLITYTISNFLWQFAQGVAIRGDRIEEEFSVKTINMAYQQIAFYIEGVKNHG